MPYLCLIIERDEAFAAALLRDFTPFGFKPYVVNTCEAALAMMRQWRFDAVVLDLKMDGEDGFDVLHYLAKERPQTRVLIASGLPRLDRIAERYGALDWLAKPYHIDALLQHVARLMGDEPGPF